MAGGRILKILRDYCENSSLVGLAYIANQRIHLTERLFWLTCIIISAGGSYYLIREYQDTFDSNSISIVLEGTKPTDKSYFPTVGICEQVDAENAALTKYLEGLFEEKGIDYNYDIENYLVRMAFPHTYNLGMATYYCERYINCTNNCMPCPKSGYRELESLLRLKCSELISLCIWDGKPFNCCKYFLPLQTPNGLCYFLNSVHTTKRNSPHWFKTEFSWEEGKAEMEIRVTNVVELNILNPEDMLTSVVKRHMFQIKKSNELNVQLRTQNAINDPGVRAVPPEYRKCRFPDEQTDNSAYDHYSYTTCVSNCLKRTQLKLCKCNTFNYIVKSNDKSPVCDYDGIKCLDKADIMRPKQRILQPWGANNINCTCLPSCTENEIIVFETSTKSYGDKNHGRAIITQAVSTEQFRRQAVRTRLDVVVTIGGILGLFMGASVLSGIEIIYFFFMRIFSIRN